MGACVSTHNQKKKASAMKVFFGSSTTNNNNNDIDLVKPPIILNTTTTTDHLAAKPHKPPSAPAPAPAPAAAAASFRDFGSKDEAFFDSQAWLESDCDDDFMSVNGEFTPSRGNTPVHHNFSAGNRKPPPVSLSPNQPSPNGSEKKMRLSDLFKDSLRGNYEFEKEQDIEESANRIGKVETPIVHGDGNGNGNGLKTKRMHGCFPSLHYSRGSSTNGRKTMSPIPTPSPNPNPNPVVG